jgi:hypothetical protein
MASRFACPSDDVDFWDADTWAQIKPEIKNVIAEKSRVQRAGWFN